MKKHSRAGKAFTVATMTAVLTIGAAFKEDVSVQAKEPSYSSDVAFVQKRQVQKNSERYSVKKKMNSSDSAKAGSQTTDTTALNKAEQDLAKAQKEKNEADQAFDNLVNTTLYKTIYVTSDSSKMPVPSDKESVFVPYIPEAEGAKITYTTEPGDRLAYHLDLCDELNKTGKYVPEGYVSYIYNEGNGYTATLQKRPGVEPDDVQVNGTSFPFLAKWTDHNGKSRQKKIILNITSYDDIWKQNDYSTWAQNVISQIITSDMNPEGKANAITNYVSQHFSYGNNSDGYTMMKKGYGTCWASTDMIMELGKAAGFEAFWNPDNYEANGIAHANAMLYSPENHRYYKCEAGWQRTVDPATGVTGTDGVTYDVTPENPNAFFYDKEDAVIGSDGFVSSPAKDIKSTIGHFRAYMETEIHVPEDQTLTVLGGRNDGYFSGGPFCYFENLQTVYIGKNITKIQENAYKHYEYASATNNGDGWYDSTWKFVVDSGNANYCSDESGRLYEKNKDGSRGRLLHTPGTRNIGITTDAYYQSLSKTNSQQKTDYDNIAARVSNANAAYNAANDKYNELKYGTKVITMYRAYNPNSGEHFYTKDKNEFDYIVSLGWHNEGVGWIAPEKSNTPVYRLYNANGGEHHYTTNVKEKNTLLKAGWKDEGIGWYSDDSKKTPLYRQYNPNAFANNHNYTTSKSENNHLVSLGWKAEGVGWYGVSAK